MSRIGVMVCGHGSRDEDAIAEFDSVAAGIRARLPRYDVESGFLEFATPVIREGLGKLRVRGNALCLAVPGMLFAAGHAKNDIPSVLNTFRSGASGNGDPLRARARHRRQAPARGRRPDPRGPRSGR